MKVHKGSVFFFSPSVIGIWGQGEEGGGFGVRMALLIRVTGRTNKTEFCLAGRSLAF